MTKGRFEIVRLAGLTIGRATYEPGWKWSLHVGPGVGTTRCTVEHVGLVISGGATAAFEDGRVIELKPGELFYIPPTPHDSWVVGDQPYVSLHFLGADRYAAARRATELPICCRRSSSGHRAPACRASSRRSSATGRRTISAARLRHRKQCIALPRTRTRISPVSSTGKAPARRWCCRTEPPFHGFPVITDGSGM